MSEAWISWPALTATPSRVSAPLAGTLVITTDLKLLPSTGSVKPKSAVPNTKLPPLTRDTSSSAPEGASFTGVTLICRSRTKVLPVLSVPSTRTFWIPLKFGSWAMSTVKVSLSTAEKKPVVTSTYLLVVESRT